MLLSWFDKIFDWIFGFFAIIPQTIYFIYTSCVSFLDMFQYLIRKLAGLDYYYVNGQAVDGDILVSFVRGILGIDQSSNYSTLSTVFWSLIIFSVILLVLTTIISLIKAHYTYDSKKSQPMTIITASIKSLFTMVLVPIVTIFGLYLSEIVLQYLDYLTSSSSGSSVAGLYGSDINKLEAVGTDSSGNKLYASYDFFGFDSATAQTTFSGVLFKVATYDCNRIRSEAWETPTTGGTDLFQTFNIFYDSNGDTELVAQKIDSAFMNNLTLVNSASCGFGGSESWSLSSAYFTNNPYALGIIGVKHFSKFNVGLVFYYYNLWGFNYFLGFAGLAACFTLFVNIIFGLISRMIMSLALFMVYSPIVGISPLDGGNAFKGWKKEFLSQILMAYGTVVGLNIFFIVLPFLQTISFFGPDAAILDAIMNTLIVIAGLSVVKKFTKLLSGFIGAADANETGKSVADDVKATGIKAAGMTMKTAGLGMAIGKATVRAKNGMFNAIHKVVGKAAGKVEKRFPKLGRGLSKVNNAALKIGKLGLGITTGKDGKERGMGEKVGDLVKFVGKGINKVTTKTTKGKVPVYEKDDKGKIKLDEKGNPIVKKDENGNDMYEEVESREARPGLAAFGQGLLDLSGSTLKLAGDMTGISKLFKDIGEAGVFDTAKENMQRFGQDLNLMEKDDKGQFKIPKWLQTKKQGEEAEKSAAKDQREAMENMAQNSEKTLKAIRDLINTLDNK